MSATHFSFSSHELIKAFSKKVKELEKEYGIGNVRIGFNRATDKLYCYLADIPKEEEKKDA